MLEIYNSLTRRKERFEPIEPGKVRMYVCGMTVYDYCHLGHARALVAFDVVARYLRHLGYALTYVRNITDVDDKIIDRAREQGVTMEALTERFIDAMHEDETALGVLRPDQEPRATQAIGEMHALIERLFERGLAYQNGEGDVYYDISGFPEYGKLSGKRLADLRAGARVDVDADKRHPGDFVLWKRAKPGDPSWPSPWGEGRPGWHIECSAMSTNCLGEHFDIHGGGLDLQFPHHENEIAQSEGASGHTYANVWMHNGHVRVDDEKMSKSLGNFFTVRDILARYRPEAVRHFLLSSHYRSPLNYTSEALDHAGAGAERLYLALRGLPMVEPGDAGTDYRDRFSAAMNDDFNTPEALAVLFELARAVNRLRETDTDEAARHAGVLRELGGVLGLLQTDPEQYLKGDSGAEVAPGLTAAAIDDLLEERQAARKGRDFARADAIRDQLQGAGIIIEDGAGGSTWRKG
ncbi:cysteinyl-tRNA synthetase [Natronocella acetinitrilica]|uniref:Cysteine--tRNA ligase n=1 Tax=Natronocella acetinitrilica TaxID=414046 RepID=A0AAE3KCC6_9GAMM|nr:cysteine--tRNA ligase [Natronocella acetinitrilica]MCP1676715.1 cysteinyl-tRNA synthetase [Natronocella acetinitrilica]